MSGSGFVYGDGTNGCGVGDGRGVSGRGGVCGRGVDLTGIYGVGLVGGLTGRYGYTGRIVVGLLGAETRYFLYLSSSASDVYTGPRDWTVRDQDAALPRPLYAWHVYTPRLDKRTE